MDGEGRERRLVGGWREDETSLVEEEDPRRRLTHHHHLQLQHVAERKGEPR